MKDKKYFLLYKAIGAARGEKTQLLNEIQYNNVREQILAKADILILDGYIDERDKVRTDPLRIPLNNMMVTTDVLVPGAIEIINDKNMVGIQ